MKSLSLVTLCLATAAAAQTFEPEGKRKMESARQMMFEAKLSPYTPLLDRPFMSLPATERPYYAVFGGGAMLMGEVELDYQLFQKFGSLAFGLSVGYSEKFGKALVKSADGTWSRSDQTTGMRVVPVKALLAYRFDYAKERWNVPLVPYVKGAFVAMPYAMLSGVDVESYSVKRGQGIKYGLAAVGGLALQLDFLDPRLARDFDSSMGVNHTYLFAEATLQAMTVFNQSATDLDFSSQHVMFGLGFEF